VLLVEDEDLIRDLAEQILGEAGYRVLPAANAGEAMEIAERLDEPIDLLLTDLVMPGISGADLAQRLALRHPGMRILYMSGYSDSLIFRHGVLQERAAFLRKPFSAAELERRVAELLAGAARD
jgi:two-component system, cell cycle sensor histidine kinase and response regulator CckA